MQICANNPNPWGTLALICILASKSNQTQPPGRRRPINISTKCCRWPGPTIPSPPSSSFVTYGTIPMISENLMKKPSTVPPYGSTATTPRLLPATPPLSPVSLPSRSGGTMDDFVQILNRLARARDRYERDSDYRFLLDRVSDLFADHLRSDMRNLKQQKQPYMDISSAALYCPPIGSSLDRSTLLCESIARILFPREESCPEEEYQGLDYAQRVRARLRMEVLVPLTNFLLSNSSLTHRGFCPVKKYLDELKGGLGQPIEPGALLPHDIIGYVDDEDVGQAAELQWRRMVEDIYLKQGNKLSNCLAVCNVSPTVAHMNVSVALSVLASQLSEEPWKGKVINFSPNPQLHNLATPQGDDDLKSKCAFVRRMHCALEIDLGKVFDLILEVAVDGNLRPDQMIKKVLVLTDFQTIDLAESDYEAIQNKFKAKGYEDAVPQIVYWKLQSWGTPVAPCRRPGVSTLDGFSDNLLKLFLDSNGEVGPYHVMEAAVSGKEYENLAVCD